MKIEELMKPRFKVVADFPGNLFLVGTILTQDAEEPDDWVDAKQSLRSPVCRFYPGMFPANFRKLEWWEEREPEEMPKYIKNTADGRVDRFLKVKVSSRYPEKITALIYLKGGKYKCIENKRALPATLEQYREQMDKDSGWAE